jgi:DNA-binding response OmpR family regulator
VLQEVPVIMLTGKATREAVLKGIAAGADGYITKPFEPHSLLRAVRAVLGLPEES